MSDLPLGRVWFVVVLPPPVTGMTTVSQWMVEKTAALADVRVLAVRKPRRFARLWPLIKHVRLLLQTLRAAAQASRGDAYYFVLDSGGGVLGSIALAGVARLRGLRLVVHHHVFGYLNRPNGLARAFFAICGRQARHLVLCPCMAAKLVDTYGPGLSTYVLSNAHLVPTPANQTPRHRLRSIGFLGNITREKGIDAFIDTLERVQEQDRDLHAVIAGPASDGEVAAEIRRFVDAAPDRRRWLGPVYGPAKDAFFDEIDLLLFPTQYANEAEPLTIYEALKRGIPVLGAPLGCIPDQLGPDAVSRPDQPFAPWAAARILAAHNDPAAFAAMVAQIAVPPERPIEDLLSGAFS